MTDVTLLSLHVQLAVLQNLALLNYLLLALVALEIFHKRLLHHHFRASRLYC